MGSTRVGGPGWLYRPGCPGRRPWESVPHRASCVRFILRRRQPRASRRCWPDPCSHSHGLGRGAACSWTGAEAQGGTSARGPSARLHHLRGRPRPRPFVLSALPPGRRGRSSRPTWPSGGTRVARSGSPRFEGTDGNHVQARWAASQPPGAAALVDSCRGRCPRTGVATSTTALARTPEGGLRATLTCPEPASGRTETGPRPGSAHGLRVAEPRLARRRPVLLWG